VASLADKTKDKTGVAAAPGLRGLPFVLALIAVAAAIFAIGRWYNSSYAFFMGYVVVQYIVLGTAWNILGGYTGYVNFGVTAFFALGAYSTVVLHKLVPAMPLPVMILIGGALAGLVGLGTGYLTLRLRGVFFSIATLALAVVVQTLIINWDFVGGARGAYVLRPRVAPLIGGEYVQYLFLLMLGMCVIVLATARAIERSALGYGFAAIRDDEAAAEASGVPTLRLKLIATTLSGGFMGMAGAPLPYYVTYLDPASGFSLNYAVNAIAMPLIGGTGSWLGPVVGAVLVGGLQEYLRVTISSAVNVLVAGVLMVTFVILAPQGIVGLFQRKKK
jgi:branched-chain amino acid transport system permease protein